jgi:cytochrome c biogenesis protein CcdA
MMGDNIMFELLFILSAIALLDSLTLLPLAILPLTVALGDKRPWKLALSFVAGVFAAYFLCGIPILVGAEVLLEKFGAYLNRLWNQPNGLELAVQILIGSLFLWSAWLVWRNKKTKAKIGPTSSPSPSSLALLGITLVVVGLPGAVPYLAAIERIVHHNPGWTKAIGYLAFYNLMFILPLLGLIVLRAVLGGRAVTFFQAVSTFCMGAMPRVTAVLFFLLGFVMVADGIGWFCGYPLLPVSP